MTESNCYVPNNPALYGLSIGGYGGGGGGANNGEPYSPSPSPCDLNRYSSDSYTPQYWPADDMGTFSLTPLDFDPIFGYGPSFKNEFSGKDKPSCGGDMADVLLSLKHPIVHPGQISPGSYGCSGNQQYQGPSASLSYTVHPQMLQMSPNGYNSQCYSTSLDAAGVFGPNQPSVNVFPSMSVNVSMNIPMPTHTTTIMNNEHGQISCPQVQWNVGTNGSPIHCQSQSALLTPQTFNTQPGPTYSITADFRPQTVSASQDSPLITSSYKGCQSPIRRLSGSTTPCIHSNSLRLTSDSDDDSQHNNLCRICGKTYARPSTLKTHLRTHSGEKPYRCDECNKSFSQAANLTAHVRTHSGEKPFRCPVCDRRFSQSSSVTTHMRTHSGERPYRCRLCKKAFSDSSTLTKHLRIHSGEKPYQCKLCLLRFSQSGNLNRHMRVHGSNVPL